MGRATKDATHHVGDEEDGAGVSQKNGLCMRRENKYATHHVGDEEDGNGVYNHGSVISRGIKQHLHGSGYHEPVQEKQTQPKHAMVQVQSINQQREPCSEVRSGVRDEDVHGPGDGGH